MAKGKGKKATPAAATEEPEYDDAQDMEPEAPAKAKKPRAARKKKADEPAAEAAAPTKGKGRKSGGAASSSAGPKKRKRSTSNDDRPDHADEEEEAAQQPAEEEDSTPVDQELVDQAFKEFRAANTRLPTSEELADMLECEVAVAAGLLKKKKAAVDALSNARKAKKVAGYNQLAVKAGYGDFKACVGDGAEPYSLAVASGVDSHRSILSMSDIVRLGRFVPEQTNHASYDDDEFEQRITLMEQTTMPADAARELLGNVESFMKSVSLAATRHAYVSRGAVKVKASDAKAVLAPYLENFHFTAIVPPLGLVQAGHGMGLFEGADCKLDPLDQKERNSANAKHASKNNKLALALTKKMKKDKVEAAKRRADAKADREKEAAKEAAGLAAAGGR